MDPRRGKPTSAKRGRVSPLGAFKSAIGRILPLAALFALVVGVILWRRADEELARVARDALQKLYPNLTVSLESARLDATRGLRLYSVEWRRRNSAAPFFRADEIYVECPLELKKLLEGKYHPRRFVLNRSELRVDGGLKELRDDLRAMIPKADETNAAPPTIELRDASLRFDGSVVSGVRIRLEPLDDVAENASPNAAIGEREPTLPDPNQADDPPREESPNESAVEPTAQNGGFAGYRPVEIDDGFEDARVRRGSDKPAKSPEKVGVNDAPQESRGNARRRWRVGIDASNPYVKELRASGEFDGDVWNLSGAVEDLDLATFAPVLRAAFPTQSQLVDGIQGKTSLDLTLGGDVRGLDSAKTRIEGAVQNAALSSSLLKYPISELSAKYLVADELIEIADVAAGCGQTSIKAAFRRRGAFSEPGASTLRARVGNIPVSNADAVRLIQIASRFPTVSSERMNRLLNVLDDYRYSGLGDFDVTLEKTEATGGVWTPKHVVVDARNVDFLCVAFPYRLEELAGKISLDADETFLFSLNSQRATSNVRLEGRFDSALSHPRGRADFIVKNCAIDNRLLDAVPKKGRETLRELSPSGVFDARVRVAYDPDAEPDDDKLTIEAVAALREGSVQYSRFPMPISSIVGDVYMRDDAWLFSNLSGKSGGATFAASGSLVSGRGYSALSRAFSAANRHSPEALAASDEKDDAPGDLRSPAPIELFSAIPAVAGAPLPDEHWRFLLAANANKFPLGEELRDALGHSEARDILERTRLEGKADGQIRVGFRSDEKRVALQFDATPVPNSASFQPEGFPFAFFDLEGKASWRDGTFTAEGLRAKSGNTTCSANVSIRTIPNVGRVCDVDRLRIDQLQIDRDLQSVAKGGFRKFLDFLQPKGFFNVDGSIRVSRDFSPNAKIKTAWNLRFVAQQNSARPGVEIQGICGRAQTYGLATEGAPPLAYGELSLDTLFYKDAQIANLVGSFYYDGSAFLWGRRAPLFQKTPVYLDPFIRQTIEAANVEKNASRSVTRGQDASPPGFAAPKNAGAPIAAAQEKAEPIQAEIFGGRAVCDGLFLAEDAPQYRFVASLHDAKLDETLRVLAPGSKPLQGRVGVNLTLQGEGKNIASLKGEGDVAVRDAQLYELPQIVKILQILSVQEPGEKAFSSCDVDFKVLGDHVQLSRVFLEGDALTLFGEGWLAISQQEKLVDLTLSARLGNSKSQIPVVSDLLGAASDQVSQIRVEGNIASPVVQQDRLPGLKKAWWSIFPEQEPTPTDKAPVERARPVRDAWRKLLGTDSKSDEDSRKKTPQ